MFDSLALENPKHKWATLMSFTLQAALLGITIAAPLAFTDRLPLVKFAETIVAPTSTPTSAFTPVHTQTAARTSLTEISDGHLTFAGHIPARTLMLFDAADVTVGDPGPFVPGAIPDQKGNQVLRNLLHAVTPTSVAGPPTASHKSYSVSHLDEGFLVQRVEPIYPQNAIIARVQGTVVLAALIDTSGRITQLHAISGHPFLVPAAIEAVRQWRYKPYLLNGSPVEVDTQVRVVFSLNR